jgi:beta-lactamase regulating signal transducer with metallopeptidase domain
MTALDLQGVAQIFTERLLNTAVEGILLVALVWLLLRVIGRQNSGTRFAIWLAALAAVVALPLLSVLRSGGAHAPDFLPANMHAAITLSRSWAYFLFAAWGIGAGLSLVGLSVGLWRVRQIRRRCSEVDVATLDPAIAGILHEFKSRRLVKLCVSDDVAAPAAIGFFRPAIVFPDGLLAQLSGEEIKVILLHELAHLRRWDDWTNLGQKIVKALFFFHPAVWWIENRLTLEREMACDDSVLAQTASPRAYASSLISFAEKLRNARGLALAQSLVSQVCQMTQRVAHILDAKRSDREGCWTPVLGVGAGLLALVVGAAPYAPRIVAFQSQSRLPEAQRIQPAERAATSKVPMGAADFPIRRSVSTSDVNPKVIPASFNPRSVVVPRQIKTKPRKPLMMRAAIPENLPTQGTFFILQTVRYDASGTGVWTLCVWKVGGQDHVDKHWESAIVLSVI